MLVFYINFDNHAHKYITNYDMKLNTFSVQYYPHNHS